MVKTYGNILCLDITQGDAAFGDDIIRRSAGDMFRLVGNGEAAGDILKEALKRRTVTMLCGVSRPVECIGFGKIPVNFRCWTVHYATIPRFSSLGYLVPFRPPAGVNLFF